MKRSGTIPMSSPMLGGRSLSGTMASMKGRRSSVVFEESDQKHKPKCMRQFVEYEFEIFNKDQRKDNAAYKKEFFHNFWVKFFEHY